MKHRSTPTCLVEGQPTHMILGQACLQMANTDPSNSLQLWAQAKECYQCPPWWYLSLQPNTSSSLIVNTTYPTNLFIRNASGIDIHRSSYHFGEYGDYQWRVNTTATAPIHTLTMPIQEYMPLLYTFIFLIALALVWQCTKLIQHRMDDSLPQERVEIGESSPLLAGLGSPETADEPQPSTSSAPTPTPPPPAPALVPDSRRQDGRLNSLDTFRGLAIVLMIFVNYGGGDYYFFKHARWNGLTVADLVFPWFLWIMGVCLVFSVRSQLRRTTSRRIIALKIIKRCIILFALGLVVNSTGGHNHMPTFRVLGVLQRFSICYLITALMEVYLLNPQESPEYVWYWRGRDLVRSGVQWILTLVLVGLHTTITFGLPVPGCPLGYLGPGGLHKWGQHPNCTGGAAGYVDQVVLGTAHMYHHPTCTVIYDTHTPYDPEGLLGIFTSVLVVQFGAACGRVILTYPNHNQRTMRWLLWGTATGLCAGLLCGWSKEEGLVPVCKNLWSLSYVLCTASFAFILFTACYVAIDQKKWWSGNPLRYAGMNSILLYVGHEMCGDLFPWSWTPVGQYHGYHLLMNVWGTSLWVATAYVCHRKKLYFSV